MTFKINIQDPGDWPLVNDHKAICTICGEKFFGPKRATTCWNDTSEELQKLWFDTSK